MKVSLPAGAATLLRFVFLTGAVAEDERHLFENDGTIDPPWLDFDPNTIKTCTFWLNNNKGYTCEEVREIFSITPEDFTRWNPSVTLDCQNWQIRSYCAQVRSEWITTLTALPPTTSTTSLAPSTTYSPVPPLGRPVWAPLGCYVDNNWGIGAMRKRVSSEAGDKDMTVAKCHRMCFEDDWEVHYAGLGGGNACWCSSYVVGEPAEDVKDCNVPCAGDRGEKCGGDGFFAVYTAVYGEDSNTPPQQTTSSKPSAILSEATATADTLSQATTTTATPSEGTTTSNSETDDRPDSKAAQTGDLWQKGLMIASFLCSYVLLS
ncbi:hypothetical protein B0T11DRAFT_350818 [Plectosphaerella cucumerina]|uniref:WSC domain-containing protein n=1 Tax=Plectosphaerella cucumerina TaxID=40658 RepID=A0A8K0TLU6_9PEZI|nr:hypothetical protein B0T11DRAFT_350818 [Plectosphaerella cucumerina]